MFDFLEKFYNDLDDTRMVEGINEQMQSIANQVADIMSRLIPKK